jgi:hypothetical protein
MEAYGRRGANTSRIILPDTSEDSWEQSLDSRMELDFFSLIPQPEHLSGPTTQYA